MNTKRKIILAIVMLIIITILGFFSAESAYAQIPDKGGTIEYNLNNGVSGVNKYTVDQRVVAEYVILRGNSSDLEIEVNKKLKEGFFLFGPPFTTAGSHICQAMVKYK
jgi:hypothetical protein